jgi:UDP-N-acetylmuramate dehydrogenase
VQPAADVPLAPLCTLGIGGPARWLVRATSRDEVAGCHAWAADRGVPLFVLGGGSNLVIADEGVDGLVLHIALTGVEVSTSGADTLMTAGAGEAWDAVVAGAVTRGLAGVECLSGIPGTVGGTPIQNVGAYGQEVGHVIESVTAFDLHEKGMVRLGASECGFAYRMSRFKQADAGRFVVCDVTLRLREGPPTITYPDVVDQLARGGIRAPDVRRTREAVLAIRRRKGMVIDAADPDTRSVGSFFMNPVVARASYDRIAAIDSHIRVPSYVMQNGDVKIPAAWLIEQSGFAKGHAEGRVGLSTKHPLALINRGGATARDVVTFASRIKRAVSDRFNVSLRPEPVFVGFSNDSDVAYLINHEEREGLEERNTTS